MTTAYRQTRGRARIGVVVPVSNTNLEPDLAMLGPQGVSLHVVRSGGYDVDAIPDEKQMQQYSDSAADETVRDLRYCKSEAILYGCTSATLAQGPAYDTQFRQRIQDVTGVPAITAASALTETITGLGISRFAFTSPYVAKLNDLAIGFIESFGPRCVGRADTPEPWSNDAVTEAIPETVIAMAEQADCDEAEAIVISCTDFRAVEAVPEIERRLGKPVVTSNQAMMVWAVRTLGLPLIGSALADHLVSQRGLAKAG